jgi:anti-anti-sigma factor
MEVRTEGEPVVVMVAGEIDLCTSPQFRRCLLVAAQGTGRVLTVDLSRTSFLDCSGLAALTAAQETLLARHQQLRVRGARGVVRKVLELGGLAALLETHPDVSVPAAPEPPSVTGAAVGLHAVASQDEATAARRRRRHFPAVSP